MVFVPLDAMLEKPTWVPSTGGCSVSKHRSTPRQNWNNWDCKYPETGLCLGWQDGEDTVTGKV